MGQGKVLISGAGIAGPTLAYWLVRYGFEPTIIERAPAFREGGYIIDFWGLGFDVAEQMNLVPELERCGYKAQEVRFLDRAGRRTGGFNTEIFRMNLQNRFLSLQRGDLARIIYDKIADEVESIFDESITDIVQSDDKVNVSFQKSRPRSFDLVIGADGLHSQVRALTFGDETCFEKNLGYYAAAFSADSYQPRDPDVYVAYSIPGIQIARFALRNDRTVLFLIFTKKLGVTRHMFSSEAELIENVLTGACPESEDIMQAMRTSKDFYFDTVSQIHMPSWFRGRVALVGDAAACPSLLAGEGASLAMAASFILAGELKTQRDYSLAFKQYENQLKGFFLRKQINAEKFGKWFAPESEWSIFLRNQVTKLFAIPVFADYFVKDMIADDLALPDYR